MPVGIAAGNAPSPQSAASGLLQAVGEAGKPVLHVEYGRAPADFCVTGLGYGFSSMRKNRTLDAWRDPCPLN